MNFSLILLLLSSAYAINFNCLKGPQYWCANMNNAKECGRIVECFSKNINNGVFQMSMVKSESDCKMCKEIVSDLESKFIPSFTEKQLLFYIDKNICDKMSEDYSALCKTLINIYGPEIYSELIEFLKPDNMCAIFELCGNGTSYSTLRASPSTCRLCKEVLDTLKKLVSKVTPGEVKFMLELAICNQMPPGLRTLCTTVVNGYTDQVYELLKSLLDSDRVCPSLHLCSSPTTSTSLPSSSATSWPCVACLDIVSVLQRDLVNVSTSEAVSAVQQKVCSQMSIFIRGTCNSKVGEVVAIFISDVQSALNSQQICEKHSACPTLEDNQRLISLRMNNVDSPECDVCELMVGELKKLFLTKEGELKVKDFIKARICKYFGAQGALKCVAFVDKYGDIVIDYINNEMSNHQICDLLGMCTDMATRGIATKGKVGLECEACKLVLEHVKQYLADPVHQSKLKAFMKDTVCPLLFKEPHQLSECQLEVDTYFTIVLDAMLNEIDVDGLCKSLGFCGVVPVAPEGVTCTACEVLVREAIILFTSNVSQQRIVLFFDNEVCPKLDILKAECVSVVNVYVPRLLDIARDSLSSRLLCVRLHLCTLVTKKAATALANSMKSMSSRCELCRLSIEELKSLLEDKSVQTQLEKYLVDELCPASQSASCRESIRKYTPRIIGILLSSSSSICTALGMCTHSGSPSATSPPENNLECEICPKFHKIFSTISIQSLTNEILLEFIATCIGYRGENKNKCLRQLNNLQSLYDSFKVSKDVASFCEISKMCPLVFHQKRCAWGPGYWCVSRRHAEFCGIGAVRHCEEHLWKTGN